MVTFLIYCDVFNVFIRYLHSTTLFLSRPDSIYLKKRCKTTLHFRFIFIRLLLACENIRFSSLFAAGDVSLGETSPTQRQKFHNDDVKSVGRRSSYIVLLFTNGGQKIKGHEGQMQTRRINIKTVNICGI